MRRIRRRKLQRKTPYDEGYFVSLLSIGNTIDSYTDLKGRCSFIKFDEVVNFLFGEYYETVPLPEGESGIDRELFDDLFESHEHGRRLLRLITNIAQAVEFEGRSAGASFIELVIDTLLHYNGFLDQAKKTENTQYPILGTLVMEISRTLITVMGDELVISPFLQDVERHLETLPCFDTEEGATVASWVIETYHGVELPLKRPTDYPIEDLLCEDVLPEITEANISTRKNRGKRRRRNARQSLRGKTFSPIVAESQTFSEPMQRPEREVPKPPDIRFSDKIEDFVLPKGHVDRFVYFYDHILCDQLRARNGKEFRYYFEGFKPKDSSDLIVEPEPEETPPPGKPGTLLFSREYVAREIAALSRDETTFVQTEEINFRNGVGNPALIMGMGKSHVPGLRKQNSLPSVLEPSGLG